MDYDDILNQTWEDVPEPELIPIGGWLLVGGNVSLIKPKEEGKSAKILFGYKAKEPVSVDADRLDEMGNYDFTINDLNFTIYIENAADWDKVRKHLLLSGVEIDPKEKIVNEAGKLSFAKAFRGSEVVAEVGQRTYEVAGVTKWDNSLTKFAKAE